MSTFDAVHDVQLTFRGLLDAFTFPGKRVDLSLPASHLAPLVPGTTAPAGLLVAAATLIDPETTYWLEGDDAVARFLVEWSSTSPGRLEDAAFLVLTRFSDLALASGLESARTGTLNDPHLGATVLVGVDDLDEGEEVTLTGPGLEHPLTCRLPAGRQWRAARNESVREFPLGVDVAFFDRRGRVVALPRTTRLAQGMS